MRVNLGADVHASDGSKVGTVKRIVLDAESKDVTQLIVHSGMLSQNHRIVDVSMVTGQDDDGLRLNLTPDQFDELPDYVEDQYVSVPNEEYDALPYVMPGAAGGLYLYGAPYVGRGYEGSQDSFFDTAPADAPAVENRSNLEDMDVLISTGTDVVGSNGDKLGSVHEVYFNSGGQLEGFVVKAGGLLSKHDVRIPMEWVDSAGNDQIRLKITAEEAETRSYDVENNSL